MLPIFLYSNVFISIVNICRFPFDWMNPIGYIVPMILQYILISCELSLIACIISTGLGAFLYTICIVKDLISILNSINNDWKESKENKSNITSKHLRMMSKQFRSFVEFHGIVKRFSCYDSY